MTNNLVPNLAQRVFGTLFLIATFTLFIYSYGFIDFNLTLSSNPVFLNIIAPLQHLVYFDRPLSAQLYLAIFVALFVFYCVTVSLCLPCRQAGQCKSFPWKLFLLIIGILIISYPMLSYDVFNYMFHSKILWFYHANPHTIAPQEFTNDLWLRFMRWVHTPSAYGPIFTAIESPAYLLGIGKFVPTLYLMKATMAAFFVWVIYLVGKLEGVRAQLLLAFNPFLLLELVVNAHNDAVMIVFLLYALYLRKNKQLKFSFLSLALSIGVKYITALTLPLYLIRNPKYKNLFVTLILLLPVLFSPGRFQPWYLVWSLIPAALINTSWSRLWIMLTSISGLIYYIPFVATGFWNNSISFVSAILYLPIILTTIYYYCRIYRLKNILPTSAKWSK